MVGGGEGSGASGLRWLADGLVVAADPLPPTHPFLSPQPPPGKYPKKLATGGKRSREFFNRKGELKHIQGLKFWGLEDVLVDKYRLPRADARAAADFLRPILDFDPQRRATAQDCLAHPWLAAGGGKEKEGTEKVEEEAKDVPAVEAAGGTAGRS